MAVTPEVVPPAFGPKEIAGAIVAAAAVVAAIRALHRQVVVPLIEMIREARAFIVDVRETVPALKLIADEFKPDDSGRSSLRMVVDRIEATTAHNSNMAHVILSSSDIAHFETDGRGACVWVNDAYTRLCGLPLQDCLGNGWYNAIHIEDRDTVVREWTIALREGRDFIGDYRFSNHGEGIPVACRASFSRDGAGHIVGCVGTIRPLGAAQVARPFLRDQRVAAAGH